MGLRMALNRSCNHIGFDFPNAYWRITKFSISGDTIAGELVAYPDKESRDNISGETGSIGFGGALLPFVDSEIYKWVFSSNLSDVFGEYIPISNSEQKTMIYNWIKRYTKLPFQDVFEH